MEGYAVYMYCIISYTNQIFLMHITPMVPVSWEASGEKIALDDQGRLCCNGKPMTEAAIDQRLRRWCTKRKNGSMKCSQEVYDRYHNMGNDARLELIQVFKKAGLNKDLWGIKICAMIQLCSLMVPSHPEAVQTLRASCCIVLPQDECQRKVRKLVTEETGKTLKVQAGWYTERQMKDTLKMPRLDCAYMLCSLYHNIWSILNTEKNLS